MLGRHQGEIEPAVLDGFDEFADIAGDDKDLDPGLRSRVRAIGRGRKWMQAVAPVPMRT